MSDPITTPADQVVAPDHHVAKVGRVDAGMIVESAAGELIEGIVADIADGDDHLFGRRHASHQHPTGEHPVARVGHKDHGQIVGTGAGEKISGSVADIADGDDR